MSTCAVLISMRRSGLMWPPVEQTTTDGYDLQFGTNVIGHWYLTELLMPALLEGVKTSPDHHARVVTTSSGGAYMSPLHWDTFKDGTARRKKTTEELYYQSKLVGGVARTRFALILTTSFVIG